MLKSDKIFLNLILMTILTIITFLLFSYSAIAQSIPPYIYYQGRLLDQATGATINQIKSVTLSLYDTLSGGAPIYSQTKQVTITNGVFSVYLGKGEGYYAGNTLADGIPSEVFTEHAAMYLGIKLSDSPVEMTPRQLITSLAYAYKAEKANEAEHVMGQVIVDPNTGNVGIGTTSPSGLLHVYGPDGNGAVVKLPEIQSARDDGDIYIHPNSGRNVYMGFNNVLNVINGNVGIGTTSPVSKLHVYNSIWHSILTIEAVEAGAYTVFTNSSNSWSIGLAEGAGVPDGYFGVSDGGNKRLIIDTSGNIGIGTTSPSRKLDVAGNVIANTYEHHSDSRLKKNIASIDNSLDKVLALRGIEFEWRIEEYSEKGFAEGRKIGLIAQDVEQVIPEVVSIDNEGYKSVEYGNIVSVLIEAIKAQQAQIEELKARIEVLEH